MAFIMSTTRLRSCSSSSSLRNLLDDLNTPTALFLEEFNIVYLAGVAERNNVVYEVVQGPPRNQSSRGVRIVRRSAENRGVSGGRTEAEARVSRFADAVEVRPKIKANPYFSFAILRECLPVVEQQSPATVLATEMRLKFMESLGIEELEWTDVYVPSERLLIFTDCNGYYSVHVSLQLVSNGEESNLCWIIKEVLFAGKQFALLHRYYF
ncbi:unnamed protein product [Sphagnum balticum]